MGSLIICLSTSELHSKIHSAPLLCSVSETETGVTLLSPADGSQNVIIPVAWKQRQIKSALDNIPCYSVHCLSKTMQCQFMVMFSDIKTSTILNVGVIYIFREDTKPG